jgi:hypothetical protein
MWVIKGRPFYRPDFSWEGGGRRRKPGSIEQVRTCAYSGESGIA